MKFLSILALVASLAGLVAPALAQNIGLQELEIPADARAAIAKAGMPVIFAPQPRPTGVTVVASLKSPVIAGKRGRGDRDAANVKACSDALVKAVGELVKAAKDKGADAVVDIRSDPTNPHYESSADYICNLTPLGVQLTDVAVKLKG